MNSINQIQDVSGGRVTAFPPAQTSPQTSSFQDIMSGASDRQAQSSSGVDNAVLVGTTSRETPTVSELMMHNSNLRSRGWDIINSSINADKPYTRIPEGTAVYYQPSTEELTWNGPSTSSSAAKSQASLAQQVYSQTANQQAETIQTGSSDSSRVLELGVLNSSTPTVSHLLAASELNDRKWDYLALPVNADRDFNRIPVGSSVNIDRESGEITWSKPQSSSTFTLSPTATQEIPEEELPFPPAEKSAGIPGDLSQAVREFIGIPYKEMDCYSLVVKGLKNLGVRYGGTDGLYQQLTSKAKSAGLPENAFLTGEGLVDATGRKVMQESFDVIDSPKRTADTTLNNMEKVMAEGQILSFSTPTRGHTGIIARQEDGEWTFINSGRMDHSVSETQSSKEVGEEVLVDELQNWFSLARRRNEPLTITLGQIDQAKVAALGATDETLLASL
jgi:hypothetical protein